MRLDTFQKIFKSDFVKSIKSNGGEIYAVGGCVRDAILNKHPKDIDLVVRLLPFKELEKILSEHGKVDLVGESFGVIKFKPFESNEEFDIALPRSDKKIEGAKGHRSIEAQSDHTLELIDDLWRRDFTINTIALSDSLEIIDPFKGMRDLTEKKIKAVALDTFIDDPLRMLRALQFAARFEFVIEKATLDLISEHSSLIREIAPERVLEEFKKVWEKKGHVGYFIFLLRETCLFKLYFKHQIPANAFILNEYKSWISVKISLAEFLYLALHTEFESERHPIVMNTIAKFYKEVLKIDTDLFNQIHSAETICKAMQTSADFYELKAKMAMFESLKKCDFALESALIFNELKKEFKSGRYPRKMSDLSITGEDFMALGFQGKQIGEAQRKCLEAIFKHEVSNTKEELSKLILN